MPPINCRKVIVGLFKLRALLSAYEGKIGIMLAERTHYYSKFV